MHLFILFYSISAVGCTMTGLLLSSSFYLAACFPHGRWRKFCVRSSGATILLSLLCTISLFLSSLSICNSRVEVGV
ncbi:hypothetical protein BC567DRAFT_231229 [Phyllosticta citribraziliensis]